MADKVKLTRPELRKYREMLARYERYLPTLMLKQQLLQRSLLELAETARAIRGERDRCLESFREIEPIAAAPSGLALAAACRPLRIVADEENIAGVAVPVFRAVEFESLSLGAFATPLWVDGWIEEKRRCASREAELQIAMSRVELVRKELRRVNQRLNLFEKIMIPKAKRAIHVIRIYLGDEQTAAVGRAKIAKAKQIEMARAANRAATGEEVTA